MKDARPHPGPLPQERIPRTNARLAPRNRAGAPDSDPARCECLRIEPHRSAALRFMESLHNLKIANRDHEPPRWVGRDSSPDQTLCSLGLPKRCFRGACKVRNHRPPIDRWLAGSYRKWKFGFERVSPYPRFMERIPRTNARLAPRNRAGAPDSDPARCECPRIEPHRSAALRLLGRVREVGFRWNLRYSPRLETQRTRNGMSFVQTRWPRPLSLGERDGVRASQSSKHEPCCSRTFSLKERVNDVPIIHEV